MNVLSPWISISWWRIELWDTKWAAEKPRDWKMKFLMVVWNKKQTICWPHDQNIHFSSFSFILKIPIWKDFQNFPFLKRDIKFKVDFSFQEKSQIPRKTLTTIWRGVFIFDLPTEIKFILMNIYVFIFSSSNDRRTKIEKYKESKHLKKNFEI